MQMGRAQQGCGSGLYSFGLSRPFFFNICFNNAFTNIVPTFVCQPGRKSLPTTLSFKGGAVRLEKVQQQKIRFIFPCVL